MREQRAIEKLKSAPPYFAESGENQVIKGETISSVQKALNKLPYSLRIVLTLREYGGLNYKEIGAILGISEGNVKIRVFRARQRLAQILKEET